MLCVIYCRIKDISCNRTRDESGSCPPYKAASSPSSSFILTHTGCQQCYVPSIVVVIGGGTGGCAMDSKMSRKLGEGKVAVIEPAQVSLHLVSFQFCPMVHNYRLTSHVL